VENNTFLYCQKGGAKMGGLIGLLSQGVTADNATVNIYGANYEKYFNRHICVSWSFWSNGV